MPEGHALTCHHAVPSRYLGYRLVDLGKIYGLFAGLMFALVLSYTKYLELFNNIGSKEEGFRWFVALFSGFGLLVVLPAILGFFWWASAALVRYSRWQMSYPLHWRLFWMFILLFYFIVELDPLNKIHPNMASNGLAPAPNLLLLFDGKLELFQFQWGYFLLWFLLWFLVAVLHWQYFLDGLRDAWFFSSRVNRYGSSLLTGFRETARTQAQPAVTLRNLDDALWPGRKLRRVPQLAKPITAQQAQQIIAADLSGAIVCAPGQPTVLFIDLGVYAFSPGLETLLDSEGEALLSFRECELAPSASREDLVVPLLGSAKPLSVQAEEGGGE